MLCAIDEHYTLRMEMPYEGSQHQFERVENGKKCLVYREDTITKTHDGGINDRNLDRKGV